MGDLGQWGGARESSRRSAIEQPHPVEGSKRRSHQEVEPEHRRGPADSKSSLWAVSSASAWVGRGTLALLMDPSICEHKAEGMAVRDGRRGLGSSAAAAAGPNDCPERALVGWAAGEAGGRTHGGRGTRADRTVAAGRRADPRQGDETALPRERSTQATSYKRPFFTTPTHHLTTSPCHHLYYHYHHFYTTSQLNHNLPFFFILTTSYIPPPSTFLYNISSPHQPSQHFTPPQTYLIQFFSSTLYAAFPPFRPHKKSARSEAAPPVPASSSPPWCFSTSPTSQARRARIWRHRRCCPRSRSGWRT